MAGHGVDRGSGSSSGSPDSTISAALIDAKGDLIVGSADDTPARLAVGSNEQHLVADSAEAVGMKWVAPSVDYLIAAAGDIIYGSAADTRAVLSIGAAYRRLAVNSGATAPEWVADTQNTVVTTKGDILVATANRTVTRLAVGTNGQVPIADSAEASGIRWGDAPTNTSPHRQTQLVGELSSGVNATLSAGAGLNYNINAASADAVFTFADGFSSAGAVDWVSVLSADASNQGSLNASNTHYIHATYSSSTAVTWGQSLVPPQYGYTFDRTEAMLLNFEDTDGSTTMSDDFGNTWTASGNAQIDTAQSKFGTASLLLDGTGDYISTSSEPKYGGSSWEISMWVRFNALPTAGNRATLFNHKGAGTNSHNILYLYNNAGTTKLEWYVSGDGGSTFFVNGVVGTNTSWATATWYKIRAVFDALAGTYRVYLSVAGAAETQDQTTSSTSRASSGGSGADFRIGQTGVASRDLNGWVDAFRFLRCATATSTETPGASAPAIGDYPVHFFSIPNMKMYHASAAAASAGTDPTLTAVKRVFVGEQDTDGSSVTATRNYALRGQHVSDQAYASASSTLTFNHNVGTTLVRTQVDVLFNITTDSGSANALPGEVTPATTYESLSTRTLAKPVYLRRNTARVHIGDSGLVQSRPTSSILTVGTGSINRIRLIVERAF